MILIASSASSEPFGGAEGGVSVLVGTASLLTSDAKARLTTLGSTLCALKDRKTRTFIIAGVLQLTLGVAIGSCYCSVRLLLPSKPLSRQNGYFDWSSATNLSPTSHNALGLCHELAMAQIQYSTSLAPDNCVLMPMPLFSINKAARLPGCP